MHIYSYAVQISDILEKKKDSISDIDVYAFTVSTKSISTDYRGANVWRLVLVIELVFVKRNFEHIIVLCITTGCIDG